MLPAMAFAQVAPPQLSQTALDVAKYELQQVRQQYDDMLLSFATSQQRLSELQKQLDDVTKERDALKADLAKAKPAAAQK